ncbi:MAG: TIGR03621 family F420-dependent LLM class oxidoreductase [Acidimicrobiales bacterium]
MTRRAIRFALQVNPAASEIDTVGPAAEAAGFDVLTVADHIGPDRGSPLITLARIAATTTSIRLGTMVLNNDMRNPVQLAWEAATLHRLSSNRFELGLGAGHTPHEYGETGLALDQPAVRKQRLGEAVEIIAALFRGETVDYDGVHYQLSGATIGPLDEPLPILVGGNGTTLLTHAAVHADIIGLQGLGKTLSDGHRHTAKFEIAHLESQLATITTATNSTAASGNSGPELNALVQVCDITDRRDESLQKLLEDMDEVTLETARATPYFAVGTVDEIAKQLIRARDDWGISYFTTRSMDMEPVIARVRQLEA